MSDGSPSTRRNFLERAMYGLWGVIAAGLGLPAGVYVVSTPKAATGEKWVSAGSTAPLEPGVPEERYFRQTRRDGWKITSEKVAAWVLKKPGGEVVAFAPQCTHLGCAYHWAPDKQQFLCPCHASAFSADGQVLSGPAPRPLDRYKVEVRDNQQLFIGPLEGASS